MTVAAVSGTAGLAFTSRLTPPTLPTSPQAFAQTYIVQDDGSVHLRYGVISRFVAPAAEGPWTQIEGLGWESGAAFSSANVSQVLNQDPAMAACVAFGSPEVQTMPGLKQGLSPMLLALTCYTNATGARGGEALRSRIDALVSPDHGSNFDYFNVLVNATDPASLGLQSAGFAAPQLVAAEDQLYLVASPSLQSPSNSSATGGFAGCLVMPLDNDAQHPLHVRRTADGAPVVVRYIVVQGEAGTGSCTALSGISTGYLVNAPPRHNATSHHRQQGASAPAAPLRATFYAP